MTIKKIPKVISTLLILASAHFILGNSVKATVEVGEIKGYGKTYINYFMNHDYIGRDKLYLYEYSVKALERVRKQLVKEGKLKDNWVVWKIPSAVFELESEKTVLEKKVTCSLSYGETGGNYPVSELNECYSIYYVGYQSYQNLLALLLTLPRLTDQNPKITVDNIEELSNNFKQQVQIYAGGIYFSNPVWSLDSKFAAFGIWNDGLFSYEVYDVEQEKYFKTDSLKYEIATEPIWFPTGRYFSYASLSEINVFDVTTGKTENVDISNLTDNKNFELLLSYDVDENRILFAFDKNLLSNYDIYEIDLQTFETRLRARDVVYLSWRNTAKNDLIKHTTSPDGRYKAIVEAKVEGSSRSVSKIAVTNELSEFDTSTKQLVSHPIKEVSKLIIWVFWAGTGVAGGITLFLTGWLIGKNISKKNTLDQSGKLPV